MEQVHAMIEVIGEVMTGTIGPNRYGAGKCFFLPKGFSKLKRLRVNRNPKNRSTAYRVYGFDQVNLTPLPPVGTRVFVIRYSKNARSGKVTVSKWALLNEETQGILRWIREGEAAVMAARADFDRFVAEASGRRFSPPLFLQPRGNEISACADLLPTYIAVDPEVALAIQNGPSKSRAFEVMDQRKEAVVIESTTDGAVSVPSIHTLQHLKPRPVFGVIGSFEFERYAWNPETEVWDSVRPVRVHLIGREATDDFIGLQRVSSQKLVLMDGARLYGHNPVVHNVFVFARGDDARFESDPLVEIPIYGHV